VVIAIIGILVALLMPAVQAARESARQATCQNSLKQIGTGVGQHISTLGRYPTGGWGYNWTGDADQGNGQNQPGGWIYNLLPYIDQQTLHDFGAGAASSAGLRMGGYVMRIMTALPGFNCPSRRRAVDYPLYAGVPAAATPTNVPKLIVTATATGASYQPQYNIGAGVVLSTVQPLNGVARSDYAINSGDGSGASLAEAGGSLNPCEPTPNGFNSAVLSGVTPVGGTLPGVSTLTAASYQILFQANTGVSFQQSMVQPGHITDGTNYTILVGEKAMDALHYTDALTTTYGDQWNMYEGASFDISRTTSAAPVQDIPNYPGSCSFCVNFPNSSANFGSAHPNGVFFLMCDSSVRLIKYGISQPLYASLGNRVDSTQPPFVLPSGQPQWPVPPPLDDAALK
jgi:hypothetical protein